jgi:endonuclease/exonuclease/phosphatase family metal-dependent hydrolase
MKKLIKPVSWLLLILLFVIIIGTGGFLVYATITDFQPDMQETFTPETSYDDFLNTGEEYSILSWNIGYGGLDRDMDFFYDGGRGVRPTNEKYSRNISSILSFIKKNDMIDFWILQEVDNHSKRSYYDNQVIRVRNLLGEHKSFFAPNYMVRFVPMPVFNPMGKVHSGLLNMTRHTPAGASRISFNSNYKWPLKLFMPDRCFTIQKFKLNGSEKALVLINTHNTAFDDGKLRKEQLATLLEKMVTEYNAGNFVISGGDWNMNPPGFDGKNINTQDKTMIIEPEIPKDFFPDGWRVIYDPGVPTNRDVSQSYQKDLTPTTIIDFFVCSPNVQVTSFQTIDLGFQYSDHNPVKMIFMFN